MGKELFLLFLFSFAVASCAPFQTPIYRELSAIKSEDPDSEEGASLSEGVSSTSKSMDEISASLDWPVEKARLTRGFMPFKKRPHLGLDLAAPKGTPILSSQEGVVVYTGREFRGFGKMVLIDSGKGWATLYAHLDRILVQEGQRVNAGEVLGAMGRTGRASGVHLHFEVRQNKSPVDPLPLLPHGEKVAEMVKKKTS